VPVWRRPEICRRWDAALVVDSEAGDTTLTSTTTDLLGVNARKLRA